MKLNASSDIDPARTKAEEIAALRRAVKECYCGFGPACYRWGQLSPEQRVQCSLDHRLIAQRFWKNGM
ncbi:MAG TPA: hypothetical protein VLN49_04880 [Gemmatimonadaceae bacterium]|nr:hypothetical protein [Gemmatimonadaceae bacterium]